MRGREFGSQEAPRIALVIANNQSEFRPLLMENSRTCQAGNTIPTCQMLKTYVPNPDIHGVEFERLHMSISGIIDSNNNKAIPTQLKLRKDHGY